MENTTIIPEIMLIFNTYIVPALVTAFGAFLTWAIAQVKVKLTDKADTDLKKFVVKEVVRCIEQTFINSDKKGNDKLNEAITRAKEWLESKGIKISDAELITLIESSVHELGFIDK